jgi:hypothetical protein
VFEFSFVKKKPSCGSCKKNFSQVLFTRTYYDFEYILKASKYDKHARGCDIQ